MIGADGFVQAGWVHDIRLLKYQPSNSRGDRFLILGKVKHSQTMAATHTTPWFVVEPDGEILAAHCTCMAG